MAFLKSSRYAHVETVEATASNGLAVTALKLRRLPEVSGTTSRIDDAERLDLIAHKRYGEAARFWRIADANTSLDAKELEQRDAVIVIPET